MTEPALPAGAWPWLHDFARWLSPRFYRPAFRLRIHGRERIPRTGPVVLVANHSSFMEPQMIYGMLGRRSVFLVKSEIAQGLLGEVLRRIGQLSIRRGTPDRAPLLAAVEFLRADGLVGVFPEGRRGDGDMLHAEQGAAWLVRSSGAVVLPVATRGTNRPAGSRRRFRPVVDILVGAPYPLTVQRGRSGLLAATEEIRVRLADLVRELDERRGRT
ncbi:MAG: lysophospholipid acyltransferase family protein [Labedaea sp.]